MYEHSPTWLTSKRYQGIKSRLFLKLTTIETPMNETLATLITLQKLEPFKELENRKIKWTSSSLPREWRPRRRHSNTPSSWGWFGRQLQIVRFATTRWSGNEARFGGESAATGVVVTRFTRELLCVCLKGRFWNASKFQSHHFWKQSTASLKRWRSTRLSRTQSCHEWPM